MGYRPKPSIMAYFLLYILSNIAKEMRKLLNDVFDTHELISRMMKRITGPMLICFAQKDFIIVPGLGTDSDNEAMGQLERLYPILKDESIKSLLKPIVEEYGGAFNCLIGL